MKKYQSLLPLACMLVLLSLLGCDQQEEACRCPACDEQVTLSSYGSYRFANEGNDTTARCLVARCGWHVQGEHNGGVGDTLQVASCGNEGVIFVWAFNDFHAFRLAVGWTGETEDGIRIGATLLIVLAANPRFMRVSATSYIITDANGIIQAEANFAENLLGELIIGSFFRR
jgi:hypothetical protein